MLNNNNNNNTTTTTTTTLKMNNNGQTKADNQQAKLFAKFCKKGDLEKMKEIIKNKNVGIHVYNEAFRFACEKGHLKVAQWLLETNPNIDIFQYNEISFLSACEKGHLEVVKWLYAKKQEDIYRDHVYDPICNYNKDPSFCELCEDPSSYNYNNAFGFACKNGNLKVAQWLFEQKPDIYKLTLGENEFSFRWACRNGHLKVAQWLFELKPDIDISVENYEAYVFACNNGHHKVVKWLKSVFPSLANLKMVESVNF